MGDKVFSVRLPEDLYEELRATGSVNGAIKDIVETHLRGGAKTPETRLEEARKRVDSLKTRLDFRVPVGEVICWTTNPQTSPWWCPEERLPYMKELSKDWEDNGFKMCVGVKGGGTWYMPEVIEEPAQERRRNGRFSVSCKMVGAYVGDRMIWLEITDAKKALAFMRKRTDVPMALRADGHKYGVDKTYTAAFDLANGLFVDYWRDGRPRTAEGESFTEGDYITMYDL